VEEVDEVEIIAVEEEEVVPEAEAIVAWSK